MAKTRKHATDIVAADRTARGRLLAAAAELFARKGYAGTAVNEIVAAAAVTKPVLYYWFRSKEGLFLDLVNDAFTRFTNALEAVRRQPGPASGRLLKLGDRVLALLGENADTARIMYTVYYGPPLGAPPFDMEAFHTTLRATVQEIMAQGIRQGEFRPGNAEDFTWAFLGALSICIEAHLGHPELAPHTRAIFARTFQVLVRGLAAPSPKEKRA